MDRRTRGKGETDDDDDDDDDDDSGDDDIDDPRFLSDARAHTQCTHSGCPHSCRPASLLAAHSIAGPALDGERWWRCSLSDLGGKAETRCSQRLSSTSAQLACLLACLLPKPKRERARRVDGVASWGNARIRMCA